MRDDDPVDLIFIVENGYLPTVVSRVAASKIVRDWHTAREEVYRMGHWLGAYLGNLF